MRLSGRCWLRLLYDLGGLGPSVYRLARLVRIGNGNDVYTRYVIILESVV